MLKLRMMEEMQKQADEDNIQLDNYSGLDMTDDIINVSINCLTINQ